MRHLTALLPLGLLLPLAPDAAAQLTLDKQGGGLPGQLVYNVSGTPGDIYAVIVSAFEIPSQPLPGLQLQVGLEALHLTLNLPGFLGVLSGAGQASAGLGLPADPTFAGVVLPSQAVSGPPFTTSSNLVRVTLQTQNTFAPTLFQPDLPIAGGAASLLADGRVLFAGGSGPAAQTYDPRIEEWDLAGVTFGVGLFSQSTALADGRVLFTGGLSLTDGQPTNAAALFDPQTGTTQNLSMLGARAGHQATLLSTGRVLITGGFASVSIGDPTDILSVLLAAFSGLVGTTEFFDPATGAFTAGPTMLEPRAFHTATALGNGDVLVAGGMTLLPIINIPTVSNTAYQFVPAINSWGLPKLFNGPRLLHTAVRLSDGSVLLAGGITLDLAALLQTGDLTQIAIGTLDSVLRYTGGAFLGGFASAGTLSEPRAGAGAAALPGGGALFAGGFRLILSSTDVDVGLSTGADRFQLGQPLIPVGPLVSPRFQPLLVPLADGTTLVVGGGGGSEVFQP